MGKLIKVRLQELIDTYGFEYSATGKMDCPFCQKKKKLKLTFEKDLWKCPACDMGGGVLDFFALYSMGYNHKPRGREEKTEVGKSVLEFCGYDLSNQHNTKTDSFKRRTPQAREVILPEQSELRKPVSDEILGKVNRVISNIPEFVLNESHKRELLKRGLSESDIEKNGYRSIPRTCKLPDFVYNIYEQCGGNDTKNQIFKFTYPKSQVLIGIYVASVVMQQGLSPEGVPGFFRFGNATNWHWCLYYYAGMLIPTRNCNGEIVLFQSRTDNKKLPKYMTISSSSLPGGVNDSVSRCHYPISNAPLTESTMVMVTEGPLKADVAVALMGKPVAFIAIPGISTTQDLFEQIPLFKKIGIQTIYNALDMDRLTNPNVRRGSNVISNTFTENGISVKQFYWGKKCAKRKLLEYSAISMLYGLSFVNSNTENVFEQLSRITGQVLDAGLNPAVYEDASGNKTHFYWDDDSKGIDDCLLSIYKSQSN